MSKETQSTEAGQTAKFLYDFDSEIKVAFYHSGLFEHAVHAKICDIINETRSNFLKSIEQQQPTEVGQTEQIILDVLQIMQETKNPIRGYSTRVIAVNEPKAAKAIAEYIQQSTTPQQGEPTFEQFLRKHFEHLLERGQLDYHNEKFLTLDDAVYFVGKWLEQQQPTEQEIEPDYRELVRQLGEAGELDDKFWPNPSAGFYYAFKKGYKAALTKKT